jgi:hypothetical protein
VSLNVDLSKPIRTPAARRGLVSSVRDATPDEFELDWVEWKSTVDLSAKQWKAELARQIQGFANRHPDKAAQVLRGCAYLLVGVEPGNLCGVKPIDSAELEDGLTQYLGSDGPQWNPDVEVVDGQTVLVITVEPPSWGDRIFSCRKEFGSYRNGDIFIRRRGKTERANASEVQMLEERARAGGERRVAIELAWWKDEETAITPVDSSVEVRDAWLASERERWTRAYKANAAKIGRGVRAAWTVPNPLFPSPEEFKKNLAKYLQEAADPKDFEVRTATRAIGKKIGRLSLAIHNLTADNYSKVSVILSFPGPVAAFFSAAHASRGHDLAQPPRVRSYDALASLHAPSPPVQARSPTGYIDNSGSTQISFPEVDVRPHMWHRLDTVYLIADAELVGQELAGAWYATATNASGLARGKFSVRIDQTTTSLPEL